MRLVHEDTEGAPGPLSAPPSSEEKRIYRVPVFSAQFCQALLEELENFEQSDMPKGRPNTMNNHGVGEALPVKPGSEGQLVLGGLPVVLQAS